VVRSISFRSLLPASRPACSDHAEMKRLGNVFATPISSFHLAQPVFCSARIRKSF
jgi:hypothetical protein